MLKIPEPREGEELGQSPQVAGTVRDPAVPPPTRFLASRASAAAEVKSVNTEDWVSWVRLCPFLAFPPALDFLICGSGAGIRLPSGLPIIRPGVGPTPLGTTSPRSLGRARRSSVRAPRCSSGGEGSRRPGTSFAGAGPGLPQELTFWATSTAPRWALGRLPRLCPVPLASFLAAIQPRDPNAMACCFQEEGSWNLSFSGAGFLGLYHVGVTQCLRERAPLLLQGAGRIYGSSSGALNAICVLLGKPVGASQGPCGRGRAQRAWGLSGRAGGHGERGVWGPRAWRCGRRSFHPAYSHLFPVQAWGAQEMATRFHRRGIQGSEQGRPFPRGLGGGGEAEHRNAGLGMGLVSGGPGTPPLPWPVRQGGAAFQRVWQAPVPTFACRLLLLLSAWLGP